MAGTYRGRTTLLQLRQRITELLNITGMEVHDLTVGNGHAVVLSDMLLAGPPPIKIPVAEVFIFRGDQIREIRPYYFDSAPLWAAAKQA